MHSYSSFLDIVNKEININDGINSSEEDEKEEKVPANVYMVQKEEMIQALKKTENKIEKYIIYCLDKCEESFSKLRILVKEIIDCKDINKLQSLNNKLTNHYDLLCDETRNCCFYFRELKCCPLIFWPVPYKDIINNDEKWCTDIENEWIKYFKQNYKYDNISYSPQSYCDEYDESFDDYSKINILETILDSDKWKDKFKIEFQNVWPMLNQELYLTSDRRQKKL